MYHVVGFGDELLSKRETDDGKEVREFAYRFEGIETSGKLQIPL